MSRPHPFDLVFGSLADDLFSDLDREAGDGLLAIASFARLPSTEAILQRLGSPEVAAADASALEEYVRLLLLAFLYWRDGAQTFRISRSTLDPRLADLERGGADDPLPSPPSLPAAYYELPEHWFWAQIHESAPHEPVEGIFAARIEEGLALGAVLGLREERMGFSQISAIASGGDLDVAGLAVRRPPFAPTMPGGAQVGFRTVASEAELIRLAHLAMLCVAQ